MNRRRIPLCLLIALCLIGGNVCAAESLLQIGGRGRVATKGVAGGAVAAERIVPNPDIGTCSGWFPATPNHTLQIKQHGVYIINVRSDADLTLAVVGPKESYCNDDAHRNTKNPSVLLPSPGRYKIYVGSKDQQQHPYTIEIADGAG